ncbi:AraC family transcriptional regulator [Parashewanella curva]|uniref:AraC family transcriptional regulator n=1 Tax=Parashewanella curva TaxID=2338552 RepID=A0A3L8PWT0_9GAMM|nr:AraC family transcriptional regulator [Parashewanella curva]RLV59249.1 AraC family transcriptional regulator [Parashewanella curva]
MIREQLSELRKKPQVLVENKISFTAPDTELSIYDTYEQADKIPLLSDQLLFCGMISGKKIMYDDSLACPSQFLPHESFVIAPNNQVKIDFPEATISEPTTCLAIEISTDRIKKVIDKLEQSKPLDKDYGCWCYRPNSIHTHHTSSTQQLLNRIVQVYIENHQDRNYLIDLAITELTIRLLREQTRSFILEHCEQDPESNGINASVNYIVENLDSQLDVEQLCKLSCMSRSKFFTQFKTHFGCSPAAFQLQLRLKRAAGLIKQGQKVTTACFEVGFTNTSHFSRCFKKYFGICPSGYKTRTMG